MRGIKILDLTFGLLFTLGSVAAAHEKVVVVPLGGKGYEPQNPLVIPASQFREDGVLVGSVFYPSNEGCVKGNADRSYGCMVAPAYLPDGVTVTKLSGLLYDNTADTDIYLILHRVSINFPIGIHNYMATARTTGQSDSIKIFSMTNIDTPLVDAENYSYYITTCLRSPLVRLYAVKIHYSK